MMTRVPCWTALLLSTSIFGIFGDVERPPVEVLSTSSPQPVVPTVGRKSTPFGLQTSPVGIPDEKAQQALVRTRRGARSSPFLWRSGVIPYMFHQSVPNSLRTQVSKGMRIWMRRTCLIFREKSSEDRDYIKFVSGKGCWSLVGRVGGVQDISIGAGCTTVGTILHELGHVIGFYHEQSRPDRDKYIRVKTKNIVENHVDQYEKLHPQLVDSRGIPYDYLSVMHYASGHFSKPNRRTMLPRRLGKSLGAVLGQRIRPSQLDIAQVREMYSCNVIPPVHRGYAGACLRSSDGRGMDYRGKLDYTESGATCQSWSSQYPHGHDSFVGDIHEDEVVNGLGDHSFCRNPGGRRDRPWCYTTRTEIEWELCDITLCGSVST